MIKVAIVEDDPEIAKELQSYFIKLGEETGDVFETLWFCNACTFLDGYKNEYDLVLMDIKMPYLDGMTAASKMRELDKTVALIFVTDLAQFAIKGYEVKASDFIVKPIKYYGFKMRVGSVVQEIRKKNSDAIIINTQDGMVRLPIRDLQYVESFSHSLIYHFDSGTVESKGRESLSEVETKLGEYGFLRCKSSFLVNIHAIKRIVGNEIEVGDAVLSIGRTKKKEFISQMAEYYTRKS